MKLVALAALIAVCGAAKLDRTYLPPPSAHTAGGSPESLQTPFSRSSSGQGESSSSLPTGSYTNNFEGVVIDAAAAGIRTSSDGVQSGLGGPRETYGSTNSKVGDAAFRGSVAGFRNTQKFGSSGLSGQAQGLNGAQNFGAFENKKSERPQANKDRNSNIITYANDVSSDNYSYGFETDNGIAIGENGVANNGIQAQGGYSYKGDDGQVYKVTYVADEGGYRPQGAHLPTPPPIPKEILESLEQNAKEEAAGLVDDGSYDAQKYNAEGDYTHNNGGNIQYNGAQLSQFAKRPESDASASNTFINQNNQAFGKPGQLNNSGTQNPLNFNGQSNQFSGNKFGSNFGNNPNGLSGSQDKQSSQTQNGYQQSSFGSHQSSGHFGHNSGSQSQFGPTEGSFSGQSSQFGTQNTQTESSTHSGSQLPQFGSTGNQGSISQFGAQPTKPSFGQGSNNAFYSQSNQETHLGNQAFKPQGSFSSPYQAQNGFEKPQYNDYNQGNSQLSQNQFGTQGLNKPQFGSFGSNKPSPSVIGQGQSNIIAANVPDSGNQVTNTQFGAEYLPPFNKPQTSDVSTPQNSNKDSQIPNFVSLNGQNQGSSQGSSAPSFASANSAGFGPQPAKPLNNFQNQPSRPNQLNYNSNNQLTSQGQTVSNTLSISAEHSASHAGSTLAAGDKPTAIPEIELTTPLESNEKSTTSQGPQFNTQSSSFGSFGSQSSNNQGQPQIGFSNNNVASQQYTSQTLAPSFPDSRPQGSSQFVTASPTQAAFSTTARPGSYEEKPQFSQNVFGQNQQNSAYYSTQKPSFSQGPDDSYYYNQPSRPFSTPSARPEGQRFPSTPSYQSNGVASSENNQFLNQQGSLPSSTQFTSSPSLAPVAPTSPSQFTHTQGSSSSNYYNGITQASISPFPSVSPTTSTQHDTTHAYQFGSKPNLNQPSQYQQNKPTNSQLHSESSSFPSKPTFEQSSPLTQSQNQNGHSASINKDRPFASFPSDSVPALGQTPSPSFSQNKIQFGQNSPINKEQPQSPDVIREQQTTSTQQYQGTIYQYNKPAEVLPAPAQTDSSSSQNTQTNVSLKPQEGGATNIQGSKPQFGSQQTSFGQTTFSSQSQQFNLNQGGKPQASKPFSSSPSSNSPFGQNTQSTLSQTSLQQNPQGLQGTVQSGKPSDSTSFTTTQFGQTSQTGLGLRPQYGSQSAKPFGSTSSSSQFAQNTQKPQGQASGFTSQGSQSGQQSFKPFGGAQSTSTQFGQNTQTGLGSQTLQQSSGSGYQYGVQSNKPVGSPQSTPSPFGQAGQSQGSYNAFVSAQQNAHNSQIGAQPFKPFGTTSSTQGGQTIKPFGTTGTSSFQGYPSSKPQFGTQLTQTTQQPFEATQVASQSTGGHQADTFGNTPSIHSSPDSQKPQFGQNNQVNQGTQPLGTSFGQQTFQTTQFGSAPSKPQAGSQTQFGQNLNASPINLNQGSPDSQKPQFGQNTPLNQETQPSGTSFGQQTFQSTQFGSAAFKPQVGSQTQFGQNLNASPINPIQGYPDSQKPQFGQNTQLNQGTQSSGTSFGQQSFQSTQYGSAASKPQVGYQAQFGQNQNITPNKPIHGSSESQKPQFGQNTLLDQGTQSLGLGQQSSQSTQFGSSVSKPQVGSQTPFGLNQKPSSFKPFGSASSQAQIGHNSAQASSSAVSLPQQSTQGSSYSTQNKPQYDQASQGASTTSSQSQFGSQPFKPFNTEVQGLQDQPGALQNKPFGSQPGSPCCQGSKDTPSIGALNVGKPSQAFAQTQSQFSGFQGAQNFNAQSVSGKGEEFGGPRQPPSFDAQTGYHY